VIVFATDLLIVAWLTEGQKGRTIEAPEFVRILNLIDDANHSQDATEFLNLGSLSRLEQYVGNELTDMSHGRDLPG